MLIEKLKPIYLNGMVWTSYIMLQATLKVVKFYDNHIFHIVYRPKKKDWFDLRGSL